MLKQLFLTTLSCLILAFPIAVTADTGNEYDLNPSAKNQQGNYKEAYDEHMKALEELPENSDSPAVAYHYYNILVSLQGLNESPDYDTLFQLVTKKFSKNIRLLTILSPESYPPGGMLIGNEFRRGTMRGNGRYANSTERDRTAILKVLFDAIPEAEKADNKLKGEFYANIVNTILYNRNNHDSWKLQELTDLSTLPDYASELQDYQSSVSAAPVNEDGTAMIYALPNDYKKATCDGERMRWAVKKAADAGNMNAENVYAEFLRSQFDFSAIDYYLRMEYYANPEYRQTLYDLKDDESIAKLSDGIRRIKLPEGGNYIEIFKKNECSLQLAGIYAARVQYEKAAEEYKKFNQYYYNQITGNWGAILNMASVEPAYREVSVDYIFRNAEKATVSIRKVNENRAVRKYLDNLVKIDDKPWDLTDLGRIAGNKSWADCVGDEIQSFETPLTPLPHHWETNAKINLPKLPAGAYIVRITPGKSEQGHYSELLVWLSDTVITVQPLVDKSYGFLNDTKTGEPVSGRNLELYRIEQRYANNPDDVKEIGGKISINSVKKIVVTDKKGMAEIPPEFMKPTNDKYHISQFVVLSKQKDDYSLIPQIYGYGLRSHESGYGSSGERMFIITDRPVYKPADTVSVTGYPRTPSYGSKSGLPSFTSEAGKEGVTFFTIAAIYDSRGNEIFKDEKVPYDPAAKAYSFEFKLPADAALGHYSVRIGSLNGSFRVEEYKKPEYELKVTMGEKQVKLGDEITAVIEGLYYFGAPLPDAQIKYTVYRQESFAPYPFFGCFDWLYGQGYWVCSTAEREKFNYFFNHGKSVVLNGTGTTGEDGKFEVKIDTSDTIKKFGERNYTYTVEAEISDSTNRVIKGSGTVVAAAKPFDVYVRLTRGFYYIDDPVQFEMKAVTPNGDSVKGTAVLKIYRRAINDDGVPVRTGDPVKVIEFALDGKEQTTPTFRIDNSGVYELLAEFTSEKGEKNSGTASLIVRGNKSADNLFSSAPLEIRTDKSEYAVGDTAKILVMSTRPDMTLYFFSRPERKDAEIKYLKLDSYSTSFEVEIKPDDQPNLFVYALAVVDGEMRFAMKEIPIPPANKQLQVDLKVPDGKVRPGDEVPLELTVTGPDGKPVAGSFTLTVYDKSLEYIAAANIPEINRFFWGWKRYFYPNPFSNIRRTSLYSYNPHPNMDQSIAYYYSGFFYRPFPLPQPRYNYYMSSYGGRSRPGSIARMNMAMESTFADSSMAMPAMAGTPAGLDFDRAEKNESFYRADSSAFSEGGDSVSVRTNFLDRAFWIDKKTFDADGKATVKIPMPDNLTTWKVRVWSLTDSTQVGQGETEIIVSKDLIARLELPRFLVQGDITYAVANVHNYTDKAVNVDLSLKIDGDAVRAKTRKSTIKIEPSGHASVSFELEAVNVGSAMFTLSANSKSGSDALQLSMPVVVKGIDKQVNSVGRLDPDSKTASIALDIPKQRKPETTMLTLTFSPGAANTMVELLPYLAADDPRDCFGVVNKFVPAVTAKNTLEKIGVKFEDLGLKKTSRDKLYMEYTERYFRYYSKTDFEAAPSFAPETFNRVVSDSLKMIVTMVNDDGGWGWFSGRGEYSWPDTTAYVVDALLTLEENGIKGNEYLIQRGLAWLENYARERIPWIKIYGPSNTDALVARVLRKGDKPNDEFNDVIYERRLELAPYGLSMLGLAYPAGSEKRSMIIENLTQYLKVDNENGTAYLNIPQDFWWYWYGNESETIAAYLSLLLDENPKDPLTHKLARYLVTNIRNSPWRNTTRAMGAVTRVLAQYITVSGEGSPDMTVSVSFDGKPLRQFKITKDNMWTEEFALALGPDMLSSGKHKLDITFEGKGAVYYTSMLNYFTLEDKIEPAGLEMKITRKYYKLIKEIEDTNAVGLRGTLQQVQRAKYTRIPLDEKNVASLIKPGDIVEVELITEAKNDYDYVVIKDSLPAGFEYMDPRSGYVFTWGAPVFCEYRERGARFYLRNMARGFSNYHYRIRAQLPGKYLALPAIGEGVYAPDLKCNSAQLGFTVNREK